MNPQEIRDLADAVPRSGGYSRMPRSTPISEHPVYRTLRHAASSEHRGLPSERDLEKLGLPDKHRDAVAAACRAVADVFATGEHAHARRDADTAAQTLIGGLPAEFQVVDYLKQPAETPDDPAALAALTPRGW